MKRQEQYEHEQDGKESDISSGSDAHFERTKVQAGVRELMCLLEEDDKQMINQVKSIILENLIHTREAWLLNSLIEHYINTKSAHCLDILLSVREPHDKHLFDKFNDHLKGQNVDAQQSTLNFLGHLIRKQPSWLHRLTTHQLFISMLKSLKTDVHVPVLLPALLIVASLLPMFPALLTSYVPELFEIFVRLALWKNKKPGHVSDIHMLHLRIGLYALFQRLYGMYPCNFLAYLRLHYGTKPNSHLFNICIKPYLEHVRIHPLLVTASKEMEISASRWKSLEAHDIVVECASISLDAFEAIKEDCSNMTCGLSNILNYRSSSFLETPQYQGASPVHQRQIKDAFSIPSPSCLTSNEHITQIPSDSFLHCSSTASAENPAWTPYDLCECSTPISSKCLDPSTSQSVDSGLFTPILQSAPKDSAVPGESAMEINQNLSEDKIRSDSTKNSRRTSLTTVDNQAGLSSDSGRDSADLTSTKLLVQSVQEALGFLANDTVNNLGKVMEPLDEQESTSEGVEEKGSPSEDDNIFRDQVLLLHSQLLFEKHRRDMHSERNRRLFGKSKQASTFEEQTDAMKDHLKLQEQAMHAMNEEMTKLRNDNLNLKECLSSSTVAAFEKFRSYNVTEEQFKQQNWDLQKSVEICNEENIKLNHELKKLRAKLFDAENDLLFMQNQVSTNLTLKKEVARLNKELTLVWELQQKYQERLAMLGSSMCHDDVHMEMCNKAAATDIAELKKALESIIALDDAKRTRIIELEATLNKKEMAVSELKRMLEIVKSQYHEQVQVTEEKYRANLAINLALESNILQLYDRLECAEEKSSANATGHKSSSSPFLSKFNSDQHPIKSSITLLEDLKSAGIDQNVSSSLPELPTSTE